MHRRPLLKKGFFSINSETSQPLLTSKSSDIELDVYMELMQQEQNQQRHLEYLASTQESKETFHRNRTADQIKFSYQRVAQNDNEIELVYLLSKIKSHVLSTQSLFNKSLKPILIDLIQSALKLGATQDQLRENLLFHGYLLGKISREKDSACQKALLDIRNTVLDLNYKHRWNFVLEQLKPLIAEAKKHGAKNSEISENLLYLSHVLTIVENESRQVCNLRK